jgi:transposase
MIYRARTEVPWRDLPADFGAWQTVHRRFQAWSSDGTFDRVLAEVLAEADAGWAGGVGGVGRLHDRPCSPARNVRCEVLGAAVLAHRGH